MEDNTLFTNEQMPLDQLPKAERVSYEMLQIKSIKADNLSSVIFIIIMMIGATTMWIFSEIFMLKIIVSAIIVLISILLIWYNFKSYYYRGYAIREKDLIYKQGVWWRNIVIVPYNRVQHCEIDQGPIDRFFGLCELQLFTAGGSSSDITIDGLSMEDAQSIKQFIMSKTILDDEEF